MSTNSTIGIRRLDGSENKIYCHWDGYIEHNGLLLQLYYDTPSKIEELLKLGNLSALNEKIEPSGEHNFNKPESNVCVAYHRDRGEKWEDGKNYGEQEFNYLFDENVGAWVVSQEKYVQLTGTNVNATYEYHKKCTAFLIDELMKSKNFIITYWNDDEVATKERIMDVLLEKARAQVSSANQRKAEELDVYYRAYCD